jgi:hypothetical protein
MAPPSQAIKDRAQRDPTYADELRAALAKEEGLLEECEQVARDSMQNAPDLEDRREGAKLLLRILAKKQNFPWQ